MPEVHPVQVNKGKNPCVPTCVTLLAYEVYRSLYGEQEALINGDCRGGFGVNELIAFLYASGFPKNEWRTRFKEAFTGMKDI